MLQIKNCFENEELSIRDFYDKVSKWLEQNKVSVSSLSPSELKFSRMKNENTTEKMIDLVKLTTDNNCGNINNLCHLV